MATTNGENMNQIFLKELRQEIKNVWEQNLFKSNIWNLFTSVNSQLKSVYPSFLLETYHYTSQSPIIQMSTLPHFQGTHRELIRPFLKHALEEEPHHRLCIHDLKILGFSEELHIKNKPLPNTEAYLGFIFNRIMNYSPLCYLGYLYQLEFMAIEAGPKVIKNLRENGIPKESMTFLHVHAEDDITHLDELDILFNKIGEISNREKDLIRSTAAISSQLYTNMMDLAIERKL